MNRMIVKVSTSIMALAMMGMVSASALAEQQDGMGDQIPKTAEEVFDQAITDELIEQANNQIILEDKNADGTMSGAKAAFSTYSKRKGLILVTPDKLLGLIPTGHAAIGYSDAYVVESGSKGVELGKHNWNSSKSQTYQVSTLGTTTTQDAAVADWCYAKRGKPYNYNFFDINTRQKFYCSQLVWAGYKDKTGIDLNTSAFSVPLVGNPVHPIELVNTSKTYLVYRKK